MKIKYYTIYDEDSEETFRGTLEDIEEKYNGYCVVMDWCNTIEIIWDHGWDDGPHYGQVTIIKVEEQ